MASTASTPVRVALVALASLAAASCPAQLLAQQPARHPAATQAQAALQTRTRAQAPAPAPAKSQVPAQVQGAGSIAGQVVELGTNQPVAEAEVRLSGVSTPRITDANGGFRFDDVAPGLHTLQVRHIAYGTTSDTLTLQLGQHLSVRFRVSQNAIPLKPIMVTARSRAEERWWSRAQEILGRLVDVRSGRPVPYGFIALISPGGDTVETVVSDRTGRFRMMPPDSGRYRLRATALGYAPSLSAPVDLAREQQLNVELKMGARPFNLSPLTVTGQRNWQWWRQTAPMREWGFWERRQAYAKFGMGRYFTRQEAERFPSLAGIVAAYTHPLSSPCRPTVIIEGFGPVVFGSPTLAGSNDLWNKLDPHELPIGTSDVDGIEVYSNPGQMPLEALEEFGGNRCGVVVIWPR